MTRPTSSITQMSPSVGKMIHWSHDERRFPQARAAAQPPFPGLTANCSSSVLPDNAAVDACPPLTACST